MTGQKAPTALGTEKIGKLLMQYAVPAIIAMTASSLYNMVDSIFIGHGVGTMAISGLALTFPLMNLAAAFGWHVPFPDEPGGMFYCDRYQSRAEALWGRFIHWCIRYCQSAGIYICNDCDGIESGYAAHCGI